MLNEDSDPRRDDSWLAEETAAAMRDFAHTVTEVPPLRLAAGFSPARARRRTPGARRWWTWLAPVTAAATVAALAVGLVVIRNVPFGGVVATGTYAVPSADSTMVNPGPVGIGGTPRYYAAIQHQTVKPAGKPSRVTTVLTVGDSLAGERLGVIRPPSGVELLNVTAAGDDRTFVVAGRAGSGAATVIKLYVVRRQLGGLSTMTPLPIKPQPVGYAKSAAMLDDIFPIALSSSGTELAVAEFDGTNGMAVKVFSAGTGHLLRQWTTTDPSLSLAGLRVAPTLTWIDGDRALALATLGDFFRSGQTDLAWQTVRRLDLDGRAGGDLITDSTILRNVQVGGSNRCGIAIYQPPVISADGKTFTCSTDSSFLTYPLAAEAKGAAPGRVYPSPLIGKVDLSFGKDNFVGVALWASTSGDALIAEWEVPSYGNVQAIGMSVRIAVISHGTSTPLRFPKGFTQVAAGDIAW